MAKVNQRSIDRRIVRTRRTLHEALLGLMQKKRFEAITVEEICDTAGVSRSTFYSHYTGKNDLEQSHIKQFRAQLLHQHADKGTATSFGFSLPMFRHAREHLHHYRAFVGSRGSAAALGIVRGILEDLVRRELAGMPYVGAKNSVSGDVAVEYFVGAYMAVLTWWLDRGARLPPEQVDAMFQRLVGGTPPTV